MAKQPRDPNEGNEPPESEGFGPLEYRLASIEDRLIVLAHIQGDGKQHPTFVKRPEFLVEKLRRQASKKRVRKLIAQLTPSATHKDTF